MFMAGLISSQEKLDLATCGLDSNWLNVSRASHPVLEQSHHAALGVSRYEA